MSAARALHIAMNAAISGDAELIALGVRYYAGAAPPHADAPYVVGSDQTENRSGLTFRRGHTGTRNLHIWADTESKVMEIFDHLSRLLDETDIGIYGHEMFDSTLVLIGTLQDPSNLFHGIAEYVAETKVSA